MHQSRVTLVRMKTATHGADEGRLDLQKSVLISTRGAKSFASHGAVKWGQRLSLVYSIRVRVYNIRVAPLRTMPLHDARCCAAPFASTRISSLR